ncbi:MAG: preprotein translocase subunit YajC [Tissierella sp.]|uniref:preprotein translocase subunit YajC n=1 Tax=Tissierella sp. TaxID=41274 RepID=UPI003F9B6354
MNPQQIQGLIIPIGFLVIFYFFAIRPQKKKEKEITAMRESLKVGDEIITIGGIYGKIILAKEDIITLEVGSTKTRLDITRWSIGSVINSNQTK